MSEGNSKKSENKNTDPALDFNALTSGIDSDGLKSISSIYLLINYIVETIDGKVTGDIIATALNESGVVNYFEAADAVDKLVKSGRLVESGDGALSPAKKSRDEIELIEKDLPYTVREKSIRLIQKIIAKEKYKRENLAQIEKVKNAYRVDLNISDSSTEFMSLKLFAPTIEQAQIIKEKFLTNPAKVYESIIAGIFDSEV